MCTVLIVKRLKIESMFGCVELWLPCVEPYFDLSLISHTVYPCLLMALMPTVFSSTRNSIPCENSNGIVIACDYVYLVSAFNSRCFCSFTYDARSLNCCLLCMRARAHICASSWRISCFIHIHLLRNIVKLHLPLWHCRSRIEIQNTGDARQLNNVFFTHAVDMQ